MNGLLSFLLRGGTGILRESAEVYIGRALVRRAMRKLARLFLFYCVLSIFALAAVAFLYVLLYRWISLRVGDESAAAILCGANLLLIALFVSARALLLRRPARRGSLVPGGLSSALTGGLEGTDANFEAGLAVGRQIGRHVRKAAPQIALAAALVGLVVGVRPQILGLFRRRGSPDKSRR